MTPFFPKSLKHAPFQPLRLWNSISSHSSSSSVSLVLCALHWHHQIVASSTRSPTFKPCHSLYALSWFWSIEVVSPAPRICWTGRIRLLHQLVTSQDGSRPMPVFIHGGRALELPEPSCKWQWRLTRSFNGKRRSGIHHTGPVISTYMTLLGGKSMGMFMKSMSERQEKETSMSEVLWTFWKA